MLTVLSFTLLALAAPPAQTESQVVAAVAAQAKAKRWSKRVQQARLDRALAKFAIDDRVSASERLDAAALMVKLRSSNRRLERKKGDALLLKARLEGLLNFEKRRKTTLTQARKTAEKRRQRKQAKRIEQMQDDDVLYLRFARRQKRRLQANEEADLKTLEQAMKRYVRLGDRARALKVALVVATRKAHAPGLSAAEKAALFNVHHWAPKGRDAAVSRAQAHRKRAVFLEQSGDRQAAVVAHLAADHEDARPIKKAAFDAPPPQKRSRGTSALCFALLNEGFDCAAEEVKRYGQRSFYDFSRRPKEAFSPKTAAWVFGEYQSLVHGCLKEAGQRREASGSVEVEWSVANTGKVGDVIVRPRRLRSGPLHECLKGAFKAVRYPAYVGEMQHIALGFNIAG